MTTTQIDEEYPLTELQKKAVAHYDRMIRWAKDQLGDRAADSDEMFREIGEWWGGEDCPYCEAFKNTGACTICPLRAPGGCCAGLWRWLNRSRNWHDWIIEAEKVKEYIIENGGER